MPLTPEQIEQKFASLEGQLDPEKLSKAINDALNKAAKPIVSRLLESEREAFATAVFDEIGEKHPEIAKALAPEKKPDGKGDHAPDNARVVALEKQLADMKAKEQRTRARDAIGAGLRKHGIEASDLLVKSFLAEAKEDEHGFMLGDKPLEESLAEFAKTDDAKRFIPAKGGGGTGATQGAGTVPPAPPKGGLAEAMKGSLVGSF